ncbi:PEP-CTERM sorting domain-containing protein [Nodularia chucula]|uniref:PEP-CTERM sorting domain-containing protein n=1 Tax=Nodularia chucula TaxID=3093667 RepID=UPI0039C5C033
MTKNSIATTSKVLAFSLATTAVGLMSASAASASTLNIDFTRLPGSINGETGVFVADLSNIGFDITSILIADSNNLAGSPGFLSGFDLDAVKLSTTLVGNASQVEALFGLGVFDFSPANTTFTPGNQRPPVSANLFGSTGGNVNNTVATLGSFDGIFSGTDLNNFVGNGFLSLGDGGQVQFDLTSAVSTNTPLYLYFGEVGSANVNNPSLETATITVLGDHDIVDPVDPTDPVSVPEPASVAALSLMGVYFASRRKQAAKTV